MIHEGELVTNLSVDFLSDENDSQMCDLPCSRLQSAVLSQDTHNFERPSIFLKSALSQEMTCLTNSNFKLSEASDSRLF